ncbi:glycosyltransferase [Pseudoalteromonas sp. P1-7a]|uniref:glycosyltransferase n=1 Tax=Pseudoalteromonas sp. P1-7a TaxID=1723755 RepID=UPI0006D67BA2|nr:glycosyltransferase [Pseudoalteromonas sp. P1-7a]KPZ53594.1 putative glycosyltransferase EpsE [Pseudoalteromonas sp. P1-7a]
MNKVAVALSVYKLDSKNYLKESIDSLLNQTFTNFDVFIEVDGPVDSEVNDLLSNYNDNDKFHVNFNEENKGLAYRLNSIFDKILKIGQYSYIARMDADDICMPQRFDEQVNFLLENEDIAVLGSSMIEFDSTGNENYKIMPVIHHELEKNIIKRCPVNHPTVMFNLDAINSIDLKYDGSLKNTQDYYLWVDLLSKGYKFANLRQPLLKFRIDENFHKRRGFKKAVNDFNSRLYAMKTLGVFSVANILHSILLFGLRVSPSYLKKIAYKRLR